MRINLLFFFCMASLVPVKSMALEPVSEAHAMIYYQVPFSVSKPAEKKHSFGFRMDHTSYEQGDMIQYQKLMNKTAAFDFKMGREGVQGMYISGVDYLQLYRLRKAAEDASNEEMEAGNDTAADKPNPVSEVASGIGNTIEELASSIPLGFAIGGIVGIVLITGAGG